jgi:predicted DNA-binding protein
MKDWIMVSIRMPRDVKMQIKKDAKRNMRPVGLHITKIIKDYLEGDK